jgi:tetratricopeptide (TPR) repeat protein
LKIHPHDLRFEEFLLSLRDEHRALLGHLLGCADCRARLRYLPRKPARDAKILGWPRAGGYEDSLERSTSSLRERELAMRKERSEAPGLYVELMEHPAAQRGFLVRNVPRFRTWGLFELLLDRSWETAVRAPDRSEELARLALLLADYLNPASYKMELIEDLRARAWSYIGNTHRMRSDLHAAEQAFDQAYFHLKKGTREPLERAIYLDLKASLLRGQRRFDEAERLLRRAVAIFLEDGDGHRAGRSLVNLSTVFNYSGRPEECIPVLYEALDLVDPEQEPRLLLSAWHNLIFVLAELGRSLEAHGLYRKARPLYHEFTDPWTQNRRKWVKGKILRGLGRPQAAETLFLAARDGFVVEGAAYDVALISLELAILYAEQGRAAELKRLAGEMLPIFASRQIHREALMALSFLKQAVEAERASLDVVARIAAFLKRAQFNPGLRFEAPV